MEERILTLDFQAFARRLLAIPEPIPEEVERARRAGALLEGLAGTGGPRIDARYLMGLPEEVLADAYRMVAGTANDAASRAVAEEIDPEQWPRLRAELERIPAVPDPTVGPEFI